MADNFDKFLPDWQIGTLTLTGNSTAFTATDALLTFSSIQQGDFIISPDGRMLVIESITDDDNGVLSTPCPPEAAGTFQTRIRYQSDNSRYTGQTAALRRLLSGGNLFALSKLVGDPGKIIRFLGSGAFDLVDYLDDPNESLSKLAALTLAANKILNTDGSGDLTQSDITASALALLALAGEANKFAYFTAENAAALTDLTPFARQLLSKANATQMYNLLGGSSGGGWERTPGGQLIQYGAEAQTTNSAGGFSITLPTAYGAPYSYRPVIVSGNSNVGVNFSVWPEQTANAFSAVAKYADSGTPAVGILAQVNWLTIGV